ncbi:MAG: hypothetical protein ACRELB_10010, partial [Polyangiaceae bacterium]
VIWTDVVGVNAVGNGLTKTAADGWNAGAASTQSITSDGYVEFTTEETTTNKMVGLTRAVADSGYATIDFGIFLTGGGAIYIYEDGVSVTGGNAFATYAAGDVFRVQVVGGVVSYLQNGSLLDTSSKTAAFPLVVDASLYSTGATVENVTLTTTSSYWQNVVGVSVVAQSLTKTGSAGWNAGASTTTSLSGDGFVEFTTGETNTNKMVGLTHAVTDSGYATIDFGIFLMGGGSIDIFEDGQLAVTEGSYAAGDVLRVQVVGSTVTYLQNGAVLFTSTRGPTFPLVADASIYDAGATVENVTIAEGIPFWQNIVGVSTSGQSLTKTAAAGWNAGASTIASLGGDGFVEFTTGEANKHKMAGLTHTVTDSGYVTIDFGLFLAADGSVSVYEDGSLEGSFGSYVAGDVFVVQVTGGVVTYLKNGALLYTSTRSPTFPLVADASLYSTGATVDALSLTTGAPFWTNIVGVTVSGPNLTKTGATGWNAGASTLGSLSGDGYVEFTTSDTNTDRMVGLTHTVADSGFATIDYAVDLMIGGGVALYEDGAGVPGLYQNGSSVSYAPGDVLRVQVQGGVVSYWKNGAVFAVSQRAPVFPLVGDASLYQTGATVDDVSLTNGIPFWQGASGVTSSGPSLTKTGADGWNAGASSIAELDGDGYAELTTGETTTYKLAGLTHAISDHGYATIDYGILLSASGTVSVYEDGTDQGGFGSYTATDVFRVQASFGVVTYLKNGTVFYASTKAPVFPLVLDASLYSQGATLRASAVSRFGIAGGRDFACAVVRGGVQCWAAGTAPARVPGLASNVQAVAADADHACALVAGGGVLCWQYGTHEAPGLFSDLTSAQLITGAGGSAGSDYGFCAILNGGVECWTLSDPTTSSPAPVSGLTSGVQLVATSETHSCALLGGDAFCWGTNASGELGSGSTKDSSTPVQVSGLTSGVRFIATGYAHTCAILLGGAIDCWGSDPYGETGGGGLVPAQVTGLTSGGQSLALGELHSCAIVNGGAQCWGYDGEGELGNGSNGNSSVPVQVSGLTNGVLAISAQAYGSCALVGSTAECWGAGYGNVPVSVGPWAP